MLTFDATAHLYKWNGEPVPSVTQVLASAGLGFDAGALTRSARTCAEYKRDLGTHVHRATELDDKGILDEATVDPDALPYLAAWRRFKTVHGIQGAFQAIEWQGYSEALQYAGTIDRVFHIGKYDTVLDIKTGDPHKSHGPQLAAYAHIWTGAKPNRLAVYLRADETFEIKTFTAGSDWQVFRAALAIHNYKARK